MHIGFPVRSQLKVAVYLFFCCGVHGRSMRCACVPTLSVNLCLRGEVLVPFFRCSTSGHFDLGSFWHIGFPVRSQRRVAVCLFSVGSTASAREYVCADAVCKSVWAWVCIGAIF